MTKDASHKTPLVFYRSSGGKEPLPYRLLPCAAAIENQRGLACCVFGHSLPRRQMYHIRYWLCKPAAGAPRLIVAARYAPPPRRLINKYAAGITNIDSIGAV